jgi:hypothetical protein
MYVYIMCMYVCIYLCMDIYKYINTCIYIYIHLHTKVDCEGCEDPCYEMFHDQEDRANDNGILPFEKDQWFIKPDNKDGTFLGNYIYVHIYLYV